MIDGLVTELGCMVRDRRRDVKTGQDGAFGVEAGRWNGGVSTTYIGIDNGVSGAAAIVTHDGTLLAWLPTPIQRARKGNEIDVLTLWHWLAEATGEKAREATYILEEPGGSKSAKAAASMAASFGAIRAMLSLKHCRWHRTTPQAWQRSMLPGCRAGDSKPRALEAARRLWPNEAWLATKRCRTPHDGAIDAALIAEWGRRAAL